MIQYYKLFHDNTIPPSVIHPHRVLAVIYSSFFILETNEVLNVSPPQTSRHVTLR